MYMVAIVQLVFVDLAMEQCSFRPNLHKVMALEPGCEEALSVTLFSSSCPEDNIALMVPEITMGNCGV